MEPKLLADLREFFQTKTEYKVPEDALWEFFGLIQFAFATEEERAEIRKKHVTDQYLWEALFERIERECDDPHLVQARWDATRNFLKEDLPDLWKNHIAIELVERYALKVFCASGLWGCEVTESTPFLTSGVGVCTTNKEIYAAVVGIVQEINPQEYILKVLNG